MSAQCSKAFEVRWRILNLRSWFLTRDDEVYSPRFLAETLSNTRWKLRLSPHLHMAEKYISLVIERDVEDDHPEQIALNYELSFLACDGSHLKSKSCMTKFAPKSASQELYVKEGEIFQRKNDTYLLEGDLTVHCKLWKSGSVISKAGQCSLQSVIGKNCITLDGTIEYFSRLNNNSEVTANFTSPFSDIRFISFCVYHNPYYSFMLNSVKFACNFLNICSCKLFVLNDIGEKLNLFNSSLQVSFFNSNDPYSFNIAPGYSTLCNYLKNDTLPLHLEITYYPGVESENIEYNYKEVTEESADVKTENSYNLENKHSCPIDLHHLSEHEDKECDIEKNESNDKDECFDAAGKRNLPSNTFKEDLASMYNERLFCDTKLRTNTETFPAHRSILSARSSVFKKMFTTDMKEKVGECINIPDISPDTVCRMLQFIYTDCTGDLDMQSAKDLYIAADKYDVASLKQRSSSFMKKNLCPANVCEVLVLADMHQDKDLKSAAQEYVLINDEEVFYSDKWKFFMKNYGSLAAQVMYLKFTKK